jgi:TetR/AcrR family transcriptional regulator, mexJK operon transcriptional repressor
MPNMSKETGEVLAEVNEDSFLSLINALAPARDELPRVPQQDRSRQKRDKLVETATKLFIERGYEDTTSDDIAIAAGVSVGTFYKYFRNKRQVLLTIILEEFEHIFSHVRISQLDFSTGDPREVLREAVEKVLSINKTSVQLRAVCREVIFRDPELTSFQKLFRQRVLAELEESLQRAVDQKLARQNLDVTATSMLIITLFDSLAVLHYEVLGYERLAKNLIDILYHHIFPVA